MNPRLLETKFHIPSWRPGDVMRTRLWEQLQRGLQEYRKLTLISAPAGYSKTTLVAEWIAAKGKEPFIKVAWLSLDETDNDPARFFQYWLAALHHVEHTLGQDLQNLLEMPQMPPPTTILAELINDLAALPYIVVLILDDYHVIQAQLIHAALEFVLEHQPQNLHLVICTRQDPPFALAQLRVRTSITEIRAADLRFTIDETRQFFAQTMKLELEADTVHLLEARTEGWIAGVILILLGLAFLMQNMGALTLPLNNWWALFILIPAIGAFDRGWRLYHNAGNQLTAARGSLLTGIILLLVTTAFLFAFSWGIFGPALIILAGIGILVNAMPPNN